MFVLTHAISRWLRLIGQESTLKSFTIRGKVALKSMTCLSLGRKESNCSITGANSGESSLSASSMTKTGHSLKSATPLPARSRMRPGVPTRT